MSKLVILHPRAGTSTEEAGIQEARGAGDSTGARWYITEGGPGTPQKARWGFRSCFRPRADLIFELPLFL